MSSASDLHIVVATCAHRGDDARILNRQIRALVEANHRVTFVAPEPKQGSLLNLTHVVVPRASGVNRFRSWLDIRRALKLVDADVLLIHDPELVPVVPRMKRAARIWDVHEDYAASASDRTWIPSSFTWSAAKVFEAVERISKVKGFHHLIAERAYKARYPDGIFVPNTVSVPHTCAGYDSKEPRVVYLGRLSRSRGLEEMIEIGRSANGEYRLELIGPVDADDRSLLDAAVESGAVQWHGHLSNEIALQRLDGALLGLSLLRSHPNFVHSLPTKMVEYLSRGVPVLATRIGHGDSLVEETGGFLIEPGDVVAANQVIRSLLANIRLRRDLGLRGHRYVRSKLNWDDDGPKFVQVVVDIALKEQSGAYV